MKIKLSYLPIYRRKTIETLLTEEEIHRLLEQLNYEYTHSDNHSIFSSGDEFISYFKGDKHFQIEMIVTDNRNSSFYVTGYGEIILSDFKNQIHVEYVLDNSYVRLFFTIWNVLLIIISPMVLYASFSSIKTEGAKGLLPILTVSLMIIAPKLLTSIFKTHIERLNSIVVKKLKKGEAA